MTTSVIILAFYFTLQDEIPFKSPDEFKVEIDLKYKKRGEYNPKPFANSTDNQPAGPEAAEAFLVINVTELKISPDEIKIQGINSRGQTVFKRKHASSDIIKIDMGFVSDLKKSGSSVFTIFFLSAEKKQLRKIVLAVLADGTFLVNEKWHGQF